MHRVVIGLSLALLTANVAMAGELLPLRHGLYVDVQAACADRGDATTLSYYGNGIGAAQVTNDDTIVSHRGNVYRLRSTMTENANPGSVTVGHETITVLSRTKFKFEGGYGQATYRWCVASGPP